jgi:uncharacterized protein
VTSTIAGRRPLAVLVALAAVLAGLMTTPAVAAPPPAGSTWSETFIDTPDGERLHVDVMRPKGLAADVKTPVILVVSPYLGMTGLQEQPGPSNRFNDFFEGAKVFERGYSVVMVSLRGTGGSSGCLDILGPGEQTDVVTAVKWAASQPWSTGKVAMYGKSYDANTGVMGAALRPEGLAAVIAQQIAPHRYRGSYNDRVRLLQSLVYPSVTYGTQGEGAFSLNSSPEYIANSVARTADCQVWLAEHYLDDPTSDFWSKRDFVKMAEGSTVPVFVTGGYLDNATNIGAGTVDFFNALAGDKRLWLGWWAHDRGNDVVGGRLAMGREGFFDEVMRFLDHHVKGLPLEEAPTHLDPKIALQGSDGVWREEASFPSADVTPVRVPLLAGTYADDARNRGSNASGPGGSPATLQVTRGAGAWTISPELPHQVHLAGIPTATVDVAPVVPRTNVVVNVYDIDPAGRATMITRGAALVDTAGAKAITLWPTDWTFAPGHRIGLLVSGANVEAYTHVPTNTTVTVRGGSVDLPALPQLRTGDLAGEPSPRLEGYLRTAPFPLAASTIAQRTDESFPVPPAQQG